MAENKLHIDMAELDSAWEKGAAAYIRFITDSYLEALGGGLNAENMEMLNADQHTLLAYRFVLDEVMEGGFIQLLHNGYGPYILENPFPYTMKQWGLRNFSKLLYEVKKLYHIHREELEADMDEETLLLEANRWELSHGGLSGRTAAQFITYLKGQQAIQ